MECSRARCDATPIARPSASALEFSAGASRSARLDAIVSGGSFVLDAVALAGVAAAWSPRALTDTPWIGVRCHVVDDPQGPQGPQGSSAGAVPRSPSEGARILRTALEDSVARAIGGARRVAVMAGGGLDSAALLAMAVRHMARTGGTAFAVAIDFGGHGDDRPYLAALEARLRCEVVRVAPEEGAPHLGLLGGVDAAPFTAPSAPIEVALMQRARDHGAELVLSGVGGDELFDGVPASLADLAAAGHPLRAFRTARRLRGFSRPRSPVLSWVVRPLAARALPSTFRVALARRRPLALPAWAGPALRRFAEEEREVMLDELDAMLRAGLRYSERASARFRVYLRWVRHHLEVASGVARRDPFMDPSLIATTRRLPPAWSLAGGVRRGLFREAVRDLLPASITQREDKAHFEEAFVRMLAPVGGLEAMRRYARGTSLSDLGIVESARFERAFDAFVADPGDGLAWGEVWPALAVEAFLQARAGRSAGTP